MNDHFMLDLETLGKGAKSAILQIAWSRFDPWAAPGATLIEPNSLVIDIRDSMDLGMHVDPATLAWWGDPRRGVAWAAILGQHRVSVNDALGALAATLPPDAIVWAQGTDFDIPILEEACRLTGRRTPWHFAAVRDSRTVIELAGINKTALARELYGDAYIPHEATWDVRAQIAAVQRALQVLRLPEAAVPHHRV